jgi:protein-disulfide isomerase
VTPRRPARRTVLRIALVLGGLGVLVTRPFARFAADDLAFETIPGLAPLRRLAALSGAGAPDMSQALFVGLDPVTPAPDDPPTSRDICGMLGLPWSRGDALPVTYFTDIACPSCRRLEGDLASLTRDDPAAFRLVTREFPVFGPRSEAAARAIRAAAQQGEAAGEAVRAHLRNRPPPQTPEARRALATAVSLDPGTFLRDWDSADVTRSLAQDRALARRLGFLGTPGLVVGRTVVPGAVPRPVLADLIEREHADGPPGGCA